MSHQQLRSGGQIVVDALAAQGVSRVSCVPGESFLPVLDAMLDSPIHLDVCRHEAGAGNMALAQAKLSHRVGVAAVTRGPGAMHAAIAVHTAEQDAVPLILLVGQVALRDRGRGGFQEMNFSRVFGSVAKWVCSLDTVERIPETLARAVRIAEGGRPGPVVIEMPEDVLSQTTHVADVPRIEPVSISPTVESLERARTMLASSRRPILLLGRGVWSQETADAAERFSTQYQLPVLAGFRCQDYIDNEASVYAGHLGLSTDQALLARVEEADLILAVGGHFGDAETQGYSILASRADRTVIHVAANEMDLDRYLPADLAVVATPSEFFSGMENLDPRHVERREWLSTLRSEEEARGLLSVGREDLLAEIMIWLRERWAPDTIVANGAGNYAIWVHRFTRYRRYGTQLAPASGAMGFGLPAGIAAALERREQPVVVFAGDGCFMMALPELATLAASAAKVIVIVVNNGSYGTIRLHQERRYPGRASGTDLTNPDFEALASSFGISAARVASITEFARAYEVAENAQEPALIEVITDRNQATPDVTLDSFR